MRKTSMTYILETGMTCYRNQYVLGANLVMVASTRPVMDPMGPGPLAIDISYTEPTVPKYRTSAIPN